LFNRIGPSPREGEDRSPVLAAVAKRADGILTKRAWDAALSQAEVSPLLTMAAWCQMPRCASRRAAYSFCTDAGHRRWRKGRAHQRAS
jgi:hypothetical protein